MTQGAKLMKRGMMVMSEGDEGDVRDGGGGQHRMMQSNAMEWCMYAGGGGGVRVCVSNAVHD